MGGLSIKVSGTLVSWRIPASVPHLCPSPQLCKKPPARAGRIKQGEEALVHTRGALAQGSFEGSWDRGR